MIRFNDLSIILFSIFFISTHGKSEVDNEKIVTQCLDNSIEIQLRQDEPFSGNIYIEGHEEEIACKKDYKDVKNPIFSVPHKPCAPKNDDNVDVIAVIKPFSGSKMVHNISCDYNTRKIQTQATLKIHSNPTTIEKIKQDLHKNVMELWKTISDAMCDCNLKTYVNKIKSFVKPSE